MAYEVGLLWTGAFGILTLIVVWKWWNEKNKNKKNKHSSRQVVLEATNRRLAEQNAQLKNELPDDDEVEEEDKFRPSTTTSKPTIHADDDGHQSSKLKNESESSKLEHHDKIEKKLKKLKSINKNKNNIFHVKLKAGESVTPNSGLDDKTSLPITQPLQSVGAVYGWIPGFDSFSVASIPLRHTKREFPNKPKTLVCHDMRGGYTEDRFVQGFNSTNCYRINHWNVIDTFVYFSHHLVTIPPPCWTNACHQHGVKVLGTFITEWEDGAKICADLLETKESYKRFAKQLVDIACYYNFDGWLVNIENKISPDKIDNLVGFIDFLTKSMHAEKKFSEIIWYDSVTINGELKWQNELNSKNSLFFDHCDGIFLNYTWSVHHLSRTTVVAGNSRKFDVYVGVDCFGRGCFGGGGWNTFKALQVIRDQNLSAAIFAPGWVLETQGEENFTANQNKFWHLLLSYLYPHVPTTLPIASTFCQGYGNHFFANGKKLMSICWTNLSSQQLQPTFFDEYHQLGSKDALKVNEMMYCINDAYEGGGCFKIIGIVDPKIQSRTFFRLFRCNVKLPKELLITVSFKMSPAAPIDVHLLLLLEGKPSYLVLGPTTETGEESKTIVDENGKDCHIKINDVALATSVQIESSNYSIPDNQRDNYKLFQPIADDTRDMINEIGGNRNAKTNDWSSRDYLIAEKDLPNLREIRVACSTKPNGIKLFVSDSLLLSPFEFMLGQIRVIPAKYIVPSFPAITNIRCRDTHIEKSDTYSLISTTVMWDSLFEGKIATVYCYDIYCDGVEKEGYFKTDMGIFLGKAFGELYRIAQMKVPNVFSGTLTVYIQPANAWNMKAEKKDCGILNLEL